MVVGFRIIDKIHRCEQLFTHCSGIKARNEFSFNIPDLLHLNTHLQMICFLLPQWSPPCPAYFIAFLLLTHCLQPRKGLEMSWLVFSGVLRAGKHYNVFRTKALGPGDLLLFLSHPYQSCSKLCLKVLEMNTCVSDRLTFRRCLWGNWVSGRSRVLILSWVKFSRSVCILCFRKQEYDDAFSVFFI